MEPYPYTREFYYNRGRKDRLEGRKYRPGQCDGWQGRAYKDGWEQALTLEKWPKMGSPMCPCEHLKSADPGSLLKLSGVLNLIIPTLRGGLLLCFGSSR